jgi:hypothetical protein
MMDMKNIAAALLIVGTAIALPAHAHWILTVSGRH